MALLDNDVVLVYDVSASTLKKCAIGNLASNMASNDLLLVERGGVKKRMTYSNWKSSAQNTDLLLVETAGRKSGTGVKKKTTKSTFDTKVAGVDIFSAPVAIDVIPVYTSETSAASTDSTQNWNVLQVVIGSPSGDGEGRLYIGVKITASTAFYNDFCIAAVQIIDPSTQSPRFDSNYPAADGGYTWNFDRTDKFGTGSAGTSGDDGTVNQWATTEGAVNGNTSGVGSFIGAATHDIPNTNSPTFKWQRASSTNTIHVGAADGIHDGGYPGILPVGRRNIAQVSNTSYIFCETSAVSGGDTPATGDFMWIMSPYISIQNGDLLRICYHEQAGNTDSGQGFTASNTLHVFFED